MTFDICFEVLARTLLTDKAEDKAEISHFRQREQQLRSMNQ